MTSAFRNVFQPPPCSVAFFHAQGTSARTPSPAAATWAQKIPRFWVTLPATMSQTPATVPRGAGPPPVSAAPQARVAPQEQPKATASASPSPRCRSTFVM